MVHIEKHKNTIYGSWFLLTVILHIQSERECGTRSNTPNTTAASYSPSYSHTQRAMMRCRGKGSKLRS